MLPVRDLHRPQARWPDWIVSWTLFSAVVGAGFATGRELVTFFGACPPAPLLWATAACLLAGHLAAWDAAGPPGPAATGGYRGAGGSLRWLRRAIALGLAWVSLAAMQAALAHLLAGPLPLGAALGVAAAGIWAGAALPAGRGLAAVSVTLGPAMAAGVLGIGLLSLWGAGGPAGGAAGASLPGRPGPAPPLLPGLPPGPGCLLSASLYAASNGLFAGAALRALMRQRPAGGSVRLGALVAGMLLAAVASAGLLAVARAGTWQFAMPLVAAAGRLHPAAGWVHALTVAAGAYTTAVAALTSLQDAAEPLLANLRRGAGPRLVVGGLWLASVVPAAAGGFAEAVRHLYPLAGWAALAAVVAEGGFAWLRRRRLY